MSDWILDPRTGMTMRKSAIVAYAPVGGRTDIYLQGIDGEYPSSLSVHELDDSLIPDRDIDRKPDLTQKIADILWPDNSLEGDFDANVLDNIIDAFKQHRPDLVPESSD